MMGGKLGCISVVGEEGCSSLMLHQMGHPGNDLGGGGVVLGLLPASSQNSHNTEPANQLLGILDPQNEYGFHHQNCEGERQYSPPRKDNFHQKPQDASLNNAANFANTFSATTERGCHTELWGRQWRASQSWAEEIGGASEGVEGIGGGQNVDCGNIDFNVDFDQLNNASLDDGMMPDFAQDSDILGFGEVGNVNNELLR